MDKYTFITNYQYGEKTDVLQIDAVSTMVFTNEISTFIGPIHLSL